jgi:hypothetical protein
MSPEEAFHFLGLASNCHLSDLAKAYHDLSRKHHPDILGGDGSTQAELNEARDIAFAFLSDRKAVLPVEFENAFRHFENALTAERAARNANEFAARTKRISIRPVQILKYCALICASIAAAIGWAGDSVLPRLFFDLQSLQLYQEVARTVAIWLGAIAGLSQFIVQLNSQLVDAYSDRLSDFESCVSELSDLLRYRDLQEIREWDLQRPARPEHDSPLAILALFANAFAFFRFEDRRRLLVLKSIGHRLLEDTNPKTIRPGTTKIYKVLFQPSQFHPPEPRKREPPPPMTEKEALSFLMFFGTTFAVFAGFTIFLGYFNSSRWAWAPGFFAFGSAMISLVGIEAWIKARRNNKAP